MVTPRMGQLAPPLARLAAFVLYLAAVRAAAVQVVAVWAAEAAWVACLEAAATRSEMFRASQGLHATMRDSPVRVEAESTAAAVAASAAVAVMVAAAAGTDKQVQGQVVGSWEPMRAVLV